ncbi:YeeE/YedE thiosulfate transporter family protein [Methylosinus sp. LW3]|uniref:YeeE/YedE family protein n=1 Tax=Methylosinus sp. LW3 TaxID=107635 RepID=UPI0004652FDF|nr:YeeE/YedE thiosulfate transporter family protein [Methylosinus sp. LW3]
MQIDWANFTPWSAAAGGVAIGLAAGLMILLLGRIAGISGIVAGLLQPIKGDAAWRLAFVLGLVASAAFLRLLGAVQTPIFDIGYGATILAGLLVGFGARLGGGCTSGHGVCGLSRLSPRALAATAAFMTSGALTVFILRHIMG